MTLRTNTVPILEVLDKLWYTYREIGNSEYGIFEWTERTDWRRANKEKNRLTDFAEKWRVEWEPRGVVKMHHNYSNDEDIFKWFSEHFPNYNEWKPQKKPVIKIWCDLKDLSKEQQNYLKLRGIEYEKIKEYVKDYNGSIGCMVYVNNTPVGINARKIDNSENRFTALAWYDTNWIYYWWLDKTKDYVIVVEWLIDFLTIKQYESNVVWLKSLQSWFEEVIKLAKTYKLKVVFDNDWKEEQAKKRLQWVKYSYFDRDIVNSIWFEAKDCNDINNIVNWELVSIILSNQIEQTPIAGTIERYKERQEIIRIKGKLGDDWPYNIIYDWTQGIVRCKVYTIWAFSNTGKSKFAYSHVPFFLKDWKKVLYISLEESELDIFGNIACAYYNHNLWAQWSIQIRYQDFENLICIDSCHKLTEIEEVVALHKPDIVFIDYIQAIFEKGTQYEKNATIALWIQKMAIKNNCTVFSLSQISNESLKDMKSDFKDSVIQMKGAWEFYAASDVIMVLSKWKDNNLLIKIEKNKLWRKWNIYSAFLNWSTNVIWNIDDVTHMFWDNSSW